MTCSPDSSPSAQAAERSLTGSYERFGRERLGRFVEAGLGDCVLLAGRWTFSRAAPPAVRARVERVREVSADHDVLVDASAP